MKKQTSNQIFTDIQKDLYTKAKSYFYNNKPIPKSFELPNKDISSFSLVFLDGYIQNISWSSYPIIFDTLESEHLTPFVRVCSYSSDKSHFYSFYPADRTFLHIDQVIRKRDMHSAKDCYAAISSSLSDLFIDCNKSTPTVKIDLGNLISSSLGDSLDLLVYYFYISARLHNSLSPFGFTHKDPDLYDIQSLFEVESLILFLPHMTYEEKMEYLSKII